MSHSESEGRDLSGGKDDQATTVAELREIMRQFVDERDWQQFHSPKNLSMSMAIEVGELMEHFQWLTVAESNAVAEDRPAVAEIGEEMADVLCYLLGLANRLDVDLSQAVRNKMIKNRQKYPAEAFRGRYGHKSVSRENTSEMNEGD